METPKTSVFQFILNIIFFIPVTLKISGEWLCKRAYSTGSWTRTIPVALIGAVLAVLAAWQTADWLAFSYGLGSATWLLIFLVVTTLTYTHVWSSLYYFVLRHVWDLWEKLWRSYEKLWKNALLPALEQIVAMVQRAPGAMALWSQLQNQYGGRSKGIRFIETVLYIALFAAVSYYGYLTYAWVLTLGISFVGLQAFAAVAGFILALALVSLVSPLFDSKAYQSIVAYGLLGSWALVQYVPFVAAQSEVVKVATFAASSLFAITYLVPALVVGLQGGFMKRVLHYWSELLNSSYGDEEDKDYQRFYQHLLNIGLAFAFAWVLYSLSIATGLALWLAWLIAVVSLVYSYTEGFQKHFGHSQATREMALATILVASYGTYHAALTNSAALNFGLLVATLLSTGLVIYPIFYIVVRAITRPLSSSVGYALERLHGRLSSKIVAAFAVLAEKRKEAFNDRSDFAKLFGHVLNLVILVIALLQALPVVSAKLTSNFYVDAIIIAFVSINGFVLLGRLFSYYSATTLASVGGLVTLATVGYYVNELSGSLTAAALLGLSAAGLVGGVFAPLLYLQFSKLFTAITPTLAPVFNQAFEALWTVYKALWASVARQFRFLLVVLQPVLAAIARTWQVVTAQIARVFGA
ncbi:MAG: hypothetical protein Q8T09_08415 [Candidatus Melainabacteria bacterium]|nr:hypothetical protein [Candidatus Melainabacteria bacterium]